ncbi:MAG: VOC family protein [Candidatus Nanoarchaeia archaeon]
MGKVVHFEVPFDEQERAKEFYSKVFGWNFQDIPEMDYIMAHTVECDENNMPKEYGAINGGMYKRDDKSATSPVIVINVENIDETLNKIQESGGSTFREKVTVKGMGYYAQVKDTEGNIIGVWENIKKQGGQESRERQTQAEPKEAEPQEQETTKKRIEIPA